MVFKSDRQRKGFFGSRGNPRSNVQPSILKKKPEKRCLFKVDVITATGEDNTVVVRAKNALEAKRKISRRLFFTLVKINPFTTPKLVRCPSGAGR